jgi:hypothetical protein
MSDVLERISKLERKVVDAAASAKAAEIRYNEATKELAALGVEDVSEASARLSELKEKRDALLQEINSILLEAEAALEGGDDG